jgi:hypothetical protein
MIRYAFYPPLNFDEFIYDFINNILFSFHFIVTNFWYSACLFVHNKIFKKYNKVLKTIRVKTVKKRF